jgi:hypothetical protein
VKAKAWREGGEIEEGRGRKRIRQNRGGDSSSSLNKVDSSSSLGEDADVDSDLFKSMNSSIMELESGDSLSKEAEVDSDLYKSTTSSIMVPESADRKDPSSSPSHNAEEDSELYKANGSMPMELEYSVLSPTVDADDDTTLFSKTSSKSSQLEEHDQPDYATTYLCSRYHERRCCDVQKKVCRKMKL